MAATKTLADAVHETLKDALCAERASARALTKSAKAAKEPGLKRAFEERLTKIARQLAA